MSEKTKKVDNLFQINIAKRLFSEMGMLKSKLTKKRLASLKLLSLENDLLNKVSFNDIAD